MSSNPKRVVGGEISDSTYSKKSKLHTPCDDDGSHIAVVYCTKCETNLCQTCCDSIHSRKAISNHEIVKLTEKPEPPINCHAHPQKPAELVCKEPSCEAVNSPICLFCHLYYTHKHHDFVMIDDEYNNIRKTITTSLEEIEKKTEACEKNMEKYEECISTYSATDNDFMNSERDKIVKFYSDATKSALETFDDFAKTRVATLKLLQSQNEHDKLKLENMSTQLRSFEELGKEDLIENGENVKGLAKRVGENVDEPTDLIPFKSYNIQYPNVDLINIKIAINPTSSIPEISQLQNSIPTCSNNLCDFSVSENLLPQIQEKICAVYPASPRSNLKYIFGKCLSTGKLLTTEEKNNGELCTYGNGRSILKLNKIPNDDEIDLSKYTYTSVIIFWLRDKDCGKELLQEQLKNQWCSRIVVFLTNQILQDADFVREIRKIAEADRRVEIVEIPTNVMFGYYLFK